MPIKRLSVGALFLFCTGCAGWPSTQAPDTPAADAEPAEACRAEGHRQFDFWLGAWDVAAVGSEPSGVNRISRQAQGCALLEQYRNDSGYQGLSLNWYDPASDSWQQTWIDNSGLILELRGGLDAQGRMVLSGDERRNRQGEVLRDRITWTAHPNGVVEQRWDISQDGGANWQTVFDGRYTRRSTTADEAAEEK